MDFTLYFLQTFFRDVAYASPVLGFLVLVIMFIGLRIGRIEGWPPVDSLYHAFINATTVGYGDLRPTRARTKFFSVVLALTGLIFTGLVVAIALHAAEHAYFVQYGGRGGTGK